MSIELSEVLEVDIPKALFLSSSVEGTEVTLSWVYHSKTPHNFTIYRSETEFDLEDLPSPLATLNDDVFTYVDSSGDPETEYYYLVVAEVVSNVEVVETGSTSFPHEAILAMAYARRATQTDSWNPEKRFDDELAGIRFIRSFNIWEASGVASPPIAYVYRSGSSNVSTRTGTLDLPFSINNQKFQVVGSNGNWDGDTQTGIYEFLTEEGDLVFAVKTAMTANYTARMYWSVTVTEGSIVWTQATGHKSYGNGTMILDFTDTSVSGYPQNTANTNHPGYIGSQLINVSTIKKLRVSVKAVKSNGPAAGSAYTCIQCV